MCNRVRASFEFREAKVRWNLVNDLPDFKPCNNISPGRDDILVIGQTQTGNEGRLMHWPLVPSFERDMKVHYSTTNATAERLVESQVYNRLLDRRRCLIPVNGFYEWHGLKPPKTPFYVYFKSLEPFGLAGLWDTWRKPDGGVLRSFTIITTEPNELMRSIHRRMPLILHRDDEQKWLDCSTHTFDNVRSLVTPFPADLMAGHEVSKQVNNPKYDAHDCCAPISD